VSSINQNRDYPSGLPDFCNLGINLRILLAVNGMMVLAAILKSSDFPSAWQELLELSVVVQPILLLSLLLLCPVGKALHRFSYRAGVAGIVALELAITTLTYSVERIYALQTEAGLGRYWLFCIMVTVALLGYFHLRNRALSPAVSAARIQALQARIRPHFLFNSINAVLGLIRSDPHRAEEALEGMADLFRVAMAENQSLVELHKEIELSRQYLGLEQLRLGERLVVNWCLENMPPSALVPSMILQPLLENAVYHGIEPASHPGHIQVEVVLQDGQVHLMLTNPYRPEGDHHKGNKMALNNIRERLALHFDAEASLTTTVDNDTYRVHIVMPHVAASA
jgi:two-component system sensor histidine kinase AlgZ